MSEAPDGNRGRLETHISGATELRTALDQSLQETESIEYSLPSDGDLVCDGETVVSVADGGQAVAVATDRRLLFGFETPDGETIRPISYTDLREIIADDGLFGSTLTVEVWAEGVYEFTPSNSNALSELVAFVSDVSEDWQRVVATLEDCQELAEQLRTDLAVGRGQAARNRGDELEQTFEKARTRAAAADERVQSALTERIQTTRTECYEIWLGARIDRAETLMAEARQQTGARAYAEPYRRYERARAHLERALIVDIEYGFEQLWTIQRLIEEVDTRCADLSVRPTALAQQASERANGTEKLSVAVENWQAAFEHYRDALTAGWGTDIDFAETDRLKAQIAETVSELIDARRAYAAELESDGDSDRNDGDIETAHARYRTACEQLDAAIDLSREFRSGDTSSLADLRDRLDEKLDQVDDRVSG